ncbi:MAG: Carbohydrate-binding domain-containing protein [Oscillospiraceae bacterium]|jgi:hypothetical protein
MKKFRGKALATLLSLALIASSLPVTLASAKTSHADGILVDGPDNDEFWLVNGGDSKAERTVYDFQNLIYENDDIPLETANHETVDDPEIYSISHVSGDRLVSWDIGDEDDSDEGNVDLSLRSSDSEGTEVIAVLFKGTYTDDDDNDIDITASTEITIHVLDENSTVIGDASYDVTSDIGTDTPELSSDDFDDNFALKTTNGVGDSKTLSVFKATRYKVDENNDENNDCRVQWEKLDTKFFDDDAEDADEDDALDDTTTDYILECSNDDDVECSLDTTTGYSVSVQVIGDDTASLTFTAKVTNAYEDNVADDDDIKLKLKITKKVLVNDGSSAYDIIKDDDYKDTVIKVASGDSGAFVGDEENDDYTENNGIDPTTLEIDGGYVVVFEGSPEVTVKDDASIDGVKGSVSELNVDDAKKVGTIDLDAGDVYITDSDVTVDGITTEDDATVRISADNNVGAIEIENDDSPDGKVFMTNGTASSISTTGEVRLEGQEEDETVSVGTVTAKKITVDAENGNVSVEKLVAQTPADAESGSEMTLTGSMATIDEIDFAGYSVDLKTEDFQGEIPAPQNATADNATFETTDEDDDVIVKGDVEIDSVTVGDDSKVVFEGSLDVEDLDGSGTMYIGANDLYVGNDASNVLVKITDTDLKEGDVVFTAEADCVDEDDLDFFGFTVKKDEGKTTDKFVVDELEFAGLALNKTSSKIVLGESETFTASAYAPGTSLPDGYSIEFDIEDNSGVFELVDNGNGTATVTVVDYDEVFSDENKATLIAYVVDEDGDEDDDYDDAECELTALKTPEVTWTSDTTADFTLAPGASYQFKITATEAPVMTAGTAGVLDVTNVGKSGNDYFIKVTAAADAAGKETGVYVNGTKLLVVKVEGSVSFTSDTTDDLTVASGKSYQYKITASSAPTFTLGSSGVFSYTFVGQNGNDYFYKITAVGASGSETGVYVNGQKVNVAKVG